VWLPLGTLNLTHDWQLFDQASVNTETFRVTMPTNITVDGYVIIAPYYSGSGWGRRQRVYPSDDPTVITILTPPDMRERLEIVRYLGAKLGTRSRVLHGDVWSVTCEVFY
jgi:hypothetical protein